LWETLDKEVGDAFKAPESPPPGAFTISEIGAHFGMTYDQAEHRVTQLVRRGILGYLGKFGPNKKRYFQLVLRLDAEAHKE
jgi:hypothetical protein